MLKNKSDVVYLTKDYFHELEIQFGFLIQKFCNDNGPEFGDHNMSDFSHLLVVLHQNVCSYVPAKWCC